MWNGHTPSQKCGTLIYMEATTTYRCSICKNLVTHPADDDTPVCNSTRNCGLLFDDEIVKPEAPIKPSAPSKRRIKFDLADTGNGYMAGDDRSYDVIVGGYLVGVCEQDWQPHARIEGEQVRVWAAEIKGIGHGIGRTRAEAVINAYG